MTTRIGLKSLKIFSASLLLASVMSGCGLMHEDLEPCPEGLDVRFVYDYNMAHADAFADLVGGVTVYVFDNDGKYLSHKEESGSLLKSANYKMHLDVAPGHYKLVALAHRTSYSETLLSPEQTFERINLTPGSSTVNDFIIKLQHTQGIVHNNSTVIEPTWQSRDKIVEAEVVDMEYAAVTMPLLRIDNHLKVSFYQSDFPTYINPADYDLWITDHNGDIKHDNTLASDDQITYTPYSVTTEDVTDENNTLLRQDMVSLLSFSRLIDDGSGTGPTLHIRHNANGMVDHFSLAPLLAEARHAYAGRNYTPQEFFDREQDFELQFIIEDKVIKYVCVNVAILNWTKRIQIAEL